MMPTLSAITLNDLFFYFTGTLHCCWYSVAMLKGQKRGRKSILKCTSSQGKRKWSVSWNIGWLCTLTVKRGFSLNLNFNGKVFESAKSESGGLFDSLAVTYLRNIGFFVCDFVVMWLCSLSFVCLFHVFIKKLVYLLVCSVSNFLIRCECITFVGSYSHVILRAYTIN